MNAILSFGGRCTANGTPSAQAGYGYVLEIDGIEAAAGSGVLDAATVATVNTAEYAGLVVGLRKVKRSYPDLERLEIRGKSQTVIYQVLGHFGCWVEHLREYLEEIRSIMRALRARGCAISLEWTPDVSERPGELARSALDEAEPAGS